MSELILTCAPGVTVTAEGALLRVVLVPRLSGGGTLRSHGIDDWPTRLEDASLELRLRRSDGQEIPPVNVAVRSDASLAVWNGFFGGAITVAPFGGQRVYPDPEVTATGTHAESIDLAYASAAEALGDPATVDAQLASLSFPAPPPAPDLETPIPEFAPPDFHRALALLREHPAVLRALGLIVDLTVPADELGRCGGSGEVSVRWPGAPSTFTQVTSPSTAFVVSGGRFFAAPTRLVADGVVELRDWTVHGFDVDGAMSRLEDAKQAVARARRARAPIELVERAATMPALRSAGLQLVHRRRGEWLTERATRARGNAGRGTLDDGLALTAEDLVLGYRVDVRRSGAVHWHSLTRRVSTYEVGGVPIGEAARVEEGHVKPAAGVLGTDGQVRADEVVVRWDGSHLGVPRPAPGQAPRAPAAPRREMPYDFTWKHALDPAQPALPQLRFGTSYQLRLRVLDIAGGGLQPADVPGDIGATPSRTYRRYEPVLPPEMPPPTGLLTIVDGVPRVDAALLGPGGALDRLVVRSDPAGEGALAAYPLDDARMLLPPAAPFALLEQHERLNGSDEATWRIARRALAAPQASAEPRNGRSYTWIPDPAADGVSVTALPLSTRAAPSGTALSSWPDEAWPDHEPKRVRVSAGGLGARIGVNWETPTSALVRVPAAMQATIEVASYVDSELDKLAASLWVAGSKAAGNAVNNGRHPVITPARRIEVVHAVRKPLKAPAGTLMATRNEGETFALIVDAGDRLIGIDRDSTSQVDVSATWDEWGDAPTPTRIDEVLGSTPVELDAPELPPIAHEFADTKHRRVTYRLTARSRFRDYFDASDPESAFVQEATLGPVSVPSTARPAPPVVLCVVPAFRWDRVPLFNPPPSQEEGVAPAPPIAAWTHTRVGGILRVELDGPWFATGEGEQLGVVVSPGPGSDDLPGVDHLAVVATAGGLGSELVTTLYRDPLFASDAPAQPDHTTMSSTGGGAFVALDEESTTRVCVVPFNVFYADGRRFADISFAALADQTYCPQVRLCLVRLQRRSLARLEASPIVRTDIVPLLPTRTLQVDSRHGAPAVLLSGIGPRGTPTGVEVRLEAAPAGSAAGDLTAFDEATPGGWSIVTQVRGQLNTWFAPLEVPRDGRRYRIVVSEHEPIARSSGVAAIDLLALAHGARTVFADIVAL